jgi:hypothetical protein
MTKINLQRIEELIRGDQPEGMYEELFVVAFKSGLGGESFMLTLLQVSDIFEELTHEDKNYFVLGYALGQKTLIDSEEQMTDAVTIKANKTTH